MSEHIGEDFESPSQIPDSVVNDPETTVVFEGPGKWVVKSSDDY